MSKRNYVYAGYVEGRSLPEVTRAQAKKLTHMNIAFAIVRDGEMIADETLRHYLPYLEAIRGYNPDLQILLSTGGGGQQGHGVATQTLAGTAKLVESCMDLVREFGLDGIDCDWEFPCASGDMDEKYQYTALLQGYRAELDAYARARGRKCWLTAAWSAGPMFMYAVELDKVIPLMDFINIMTYDMNDYGHSTNDMIAAVMAGEKPERTRPQSTSAGHHSNVYPTFGDPQPLCCEDAVRYYTSAGIPKEKLVLGAAFYSKQWNGVPDVNHGLNQPAQSICDFGPGRCSYDQLRAAFEVNPDYIKYWDDEAKACWLYNGYQFVTYEDPRAIAEKCRFAKDEGLLGMMYWVHATDPSGALFNVIYDELFL